MIKYKEYIEKMKEKGFIHRNSSPTIIYNGSPMIRTFLLNKGKTGKILEFTCPDNMVVSLCGSEHDGGCENKYSCSLKCCDSNGLEPFFKEHKGYILYRDTKDETKSKGSIIDYVITKTVRDEKSKNAAGVNNCLNIINPVMKLIGSKDPLEYPMIMGIYQKIGEHFIQRSLTLYPMEKIIIYLLAPDVDITSVEFSIGLDIFEKYSAE